jgi:hypothetical protein
MLKAALQEERPALLFDDLHTAAWCAFCGRLRPRRAAGDVDVLTLQEQAVDGIAAADLEDETGGSGVKSKFRTCKSEQCENLCLPPHRYCGACAGYESEMSVEQRQLMIRGRLLTVAIAGPIVTRNMDLRRKRKTA